MSRTSIFNYVSSRSTVNSRLLLALTEFLARNNDIVLERNEIVALFKTKPLITSPVSKLFQQIDAEGMTDLFTLIKIPPKRTVPEVISMRHLTLDMDQISSFSTLTKSLIQTTPYLNKKIVLNTTQMLRATGGLYDIAGFQSLIVRDLLSRNFTQSKRQTWLTPNLTQFVSKVYSMSLGSAVAQWFRLTFADQNSLNALFAFYFLEQMSNSENAEAVLRSKSKYFRAPAPQDLDQIFGLIDSVLGERKIESIDRLFLVINELGVERLKLDRSLFVSRLRSIGTDSFTSSMALEYPPYFVYLILLSLGGAKIGLSIRMKDQGLIRDTEALRFADDIIHSTDLFDRAVMA